MKENLKIISKKLGIRIGSYSVFGLFKNQLVHIGFTDRRDYLIIFKLKENIPSIKQEIMSDPLSDKLGIKEKNIVIEGKTLVIRKSFAIKDNSEDILPVLVQTVAEKLSPHQKYEELKCEDCGTSIKEELLINGVATNICKGCISKIEASVARDQRELEGTTPNYILGTIYGLAGSLAGGAVWAGLAACLNRIFVVVAMFTGFLCARLYVKGVSKIDNIGKVIIVFLTFLGTYLGQGFYYTYIIYKKTNSILLGEAFQLYTNLLLTNPRVEALNYFFAAIGAIWVFSKVRKTEISLNIDYGTKDYSEISKEDKETKKGDIVTGVAFYVTIPLGMAGLFITLSYYNFDQLFTMKPILLGVLVFHFAMVGLLVLSGKLFPAVGRSLETAGGQKMSTGLKWFVIFAFPMFLDFGAVGLGVFINCHFDKSESQAYSTVLFNGHETKSDEKKDYCFDIKHWNKEEAVSSMDFCHSKYPDAYEGQQVNLEIKQGFLNIPWVVSANLSGK